MRKQAIFLAILFCLIMGMAFLSPVYSAEYRTLKESKDFKELTKGYLESYNGMVEGNKAYGVDLDWLWVAPEVNFNKYTGAAIIFEDWTGRNFGEMVSRQFSRDSNFRDLFKSNITVIPNMEALKAQPAKYLKKGDLIVKGCITDYHTSYNFFLGQTFEIISEEIALLDGSDYKIVGKVLHKKIRGVGSGPSDDIPKNVGELLKKYQAKGPGLGDKLTETDNFLQK